MKNSTQNFSLLSSILINITYSLLNKQMKILLILGHPDIEYS